jgi:heme-degrading monooxygenase HmoA
MRYRRSHHRRIDKPLLAESGVRLPRPRYSGHNLLGKEWLGVFARVSRYEIPEARIDEAVRRFAEALAQITDLSGFRDAYLLVNRDGECATTLTFWDNAAAMEATRVTASRLRTEAAKAVEGAVTSTQEFEVAIHTGST